MFRRTLILLAVTVAALVAAGASVAGVTCQTNAAQEIAGANVNGPRAGWDPPVWTFDMPDLNMSVDVQDYTRDGAAAKAQAWLQSQVPACPPTNTDGSPVPAPAPVTPTFDPATTAQAQTIVAQSDVTYVGNAWGPTPIYRVTIPSLNMTVDVAANSPDEARAAALSVIATTIGGTPVQPTTPAAPVVVTPQATAIASTSETFYVGDSWGATPIYRVFVPSLNTTIDVAANSPAEAQTAAAAVIASILIASPGNPVIA